jgi:hydrogenase nickel incorporation protein HypB
MGLQRGDCRLLVVENVGNLVCPASFDVGEHMKVALLSLPEGDDKVLKYPSIFSRIGALAITKMDLEPHMDFDVDRAIAECESLNQDFHTFKLSARTGEGVDAFCEFLLAKQSELTA